MARVSRRPQDKVRPGGIGCYLPVYVVMYERAVRDYGPRLAARFPRWQSLRRFGVLYGVGIVTDAPRTRHFCS